MKLTFVNIMHDYHRKYSTVYISQPPVALGILNTATPREIDTALVDEQTDRLVFEGDVFAFTVTTQLAKKVYRHADALRRQGKRVILGGHHVTVRPDEAQRHADAIVTGEAELLWPELCRDLLAGRLKERYAGSPTPPERMNPVDYTFFGRRPYRMRASLFATRGCNFKCAFCLSSKLMGGFRKKPLVVLEKEIDQLKALHPGQPLQFTDDNLFTDRRHGRDVLDLVRRKGMRFVSHLTVDQICDGPLVDAMAEAGCLAVATGVEGDDENCATIHKTQNLRRPLDEAVRHATGRGIMVVALLIVGLPHDTPERLERAIGRLRAIPFSGFDISLLRVWPGTEMFETMRRRGEVEEGWWLADEPLESNHVLPGYLRVNYRHPNFTPAELQYWALSVTDRLNRVNAATAWRFLRTGLRGRAPLFAACGLGGRAWVSRQARRWIRQIALMPAAVPARLAVAGA